jgi:hypothetical protein
MSAEYIITELIARPSGAVTDQIRANMEQIINANGLREYQRVFMDGSLIGNKIECAIVTAQMNIKLRLAEPTTTFIAELQANLKGYTYRG